MGGAPKTPKWDPIGFDNHGHLTRGAADHRRLRRREGARGHQAAGVSAEAAAASWAAEISGGRHVFFFGFSFIYIYIELFFTWWFK